jgi:hypothetical protein
MIGLGGGINAADPVEPQTAVANILDKTDKVASPVENASTVVGAVIPSSANGGTNCKCQK